MEKQKVRFTVTVVKEYEIDLSDYQDMGSREHPEPPCKTIEEAIKFDVQCINDDPLMFIDDDDAKLEVKYDILPK